MADTHDKLEPSATSSPADLVARIVSGDHTAEDDLVSRYSRGVTAILRRETTDTALLDDLFQETFRLAIEKIRGRQVREPEKLSGYMAGLARNLAIDHFRRADKHESIDDDESGRQFQSSLPGQYEQLLQKERAVLVRQVINELSEPRDREVLFRFYISEEDKEQICRDLSLSSLHFNRVLFRARERYRELFLKAVQKPPP